LDAIADADRRDSCKIGTGHAVAGAVVRHKGQLRRLCAANIRTAGAFQELIIDESRRCSRSYGNVITRRAPSPLVSKIH
jgi:hypothetical protein